MRMAQGQGESQLHPKDGEKVEVEKAERSNKEFLSLV